MSRNATSAEDPNALKKRQLAELRESTQPGAAEACARLEREINGEYGPEVCPVCGHSQTAAVSVDESALLAENKRLQARGQDLLDIADQAKAEKLREVHFREDAEKKLSAALLELSKLKLRGKKNK